MKKEKIIVQVEMEIVYDETKPNARKAVLKEVSPYQTTCGGNHEFGTYNIKTLSVKKPK